MKRRALPLVATHWLAAVLAPGLAAPAAAQGLPDPTRPPAGFVDPADVKAGAAGEGRSAAAGTADHAAAGLVLQSVLLPQHGKPVAVISGHYLPLGARLEQWELVSVSEHQVVLRQGGERRVLRLTPRVSKTIVESRSKAAPASPVKAVNSAGGKATRKRSQEKRSQESELKR